MLNRYDPLRNFGNIRNSLERFFDNELPLREFFALEPNGVGSMPLDVFEEGETVVVKASIPGFKPEEIKVRVRDGVVSIWGETKFEYEKADRNYHLREHRYTRLERSVALPAAVSADLAEAVFENGVLTLTIPRVAESASKEIPIKIKT